MPREQVHLIELNIVSKNNRRNKLRNRTANKNYESKVHHPNYTLFMFCDDNRRQSKFIKESYEVEDINCIGCLRKLVKLAIAERRRSLNA